MTRVAAILWLSTALLAAESAPRPELAEKLWQAHDYRGANDAFRAFTGAHPADAHARVRWGLLFLERFQPDEATKLLREALTLNPASAEANLGMAQVLEEDFSPEAAKFARAALDHDPKLFAAHELLARIALEDNDTKTALSEADAALALTPDALDALAVHAAIDYLADRDGKPWLDRALTAHAHNGKPFETVGHFAVINRRYREGIKFYQQAVATQPDLWSAHAELGLNQMRLADEKQARQELELAYNNHYTPPSVVNALRLMDSYARFETFANGNTTLRFDKREGAVLRPYFEAELKRSIAIYEQKYHWKLDGPVQFEVFPDHEDFAVRTTGIPGLGALGVTFGNIVAMDSPSSRPPGSFHWGSVMRHELSHVYTLSMTNFHVPRWFTEGVAVHEESAERPDWGDRLTPDIVIAIRDKQLLPVAELDRGFTHPKNMGQVLISYFEAGQICDFIAKQWGEAKLTEMTHAFAGTATTPDVVRQTLGIASEELDKRFLKDLESRNKAVVDNLAQWKKRAVELHELASKGQHADVIARGPAVRDLYPEFVESGSVYETIAASYTAIHNDAGAREELSRYWHAGGRSPAALKQLADLLTAAKQETEAARVLEALLYIAPLDAEVHQKLGSLYLAAKQGAPAAREFQALLAGKPVDEASAHFQLAQAYRVEGRAAQAREELLAALEIAPGFRPAQKMLLETEGVPAR